MALWRPDPQFCCPALACDFSPRALVRQLLFSSLAARATSASQTPVVNLLCLCPSHTIYRRGLVRQLSIDQLDNEGRRVSIYDKTLPNGEGGATPGALFLQGLTLTGAMVGGCQQQLAAVRAVAVLAAV